MLDNNTVYFFNIIWTYCTCMYYVSEINEYCYYYYRPTFAFLPVIQCVCVCWRVGVWACGHGLLILLGSF